MKHVYCIPCFPCFNLLWFDFGCCFSLKVFRRFLRNEDIFGFHSWPSVICTADPGTFAGSSAEQLDQIWVSRSLVGTCRALPAFTPRIVQKKSTKCKYINVYINTWMVTWGIGSQRSVFFCFVTWMGSDGYSPLMESPPPKKPTHPKTHMDPKKRWFLLFKRGPFFSFRELRQLEDLERIDSCGSADFNTTVVFIVWLLDVCFSILYANNCTLFSLQCKLITLTFTDTWLHYP